MFRNIVKITSKSRFFITFTTIFFSILITITITGCGGGGGGASGGSSGGSSYVVSYSSGAAASSSPNASSAGVPASGTVDSYALFIGISDYPGPNNDLPYASKDSVDVYNRLNLSPVWNGGTLRLLTNSFATKSAIQAAITEAKNTLKANGTFLFYYSGHGTNSGTTGYIVPYNALTESGSLVVSNMINSNELPSYLNTLPATVKKYVLIDSCRSGYFISAKSFGGYTNVNIKAKFIPMESSDPNFKDDELFTKTITAVANSYVMTSSKGSELSWESSYLQNGVFTYYLCQGLGPGRFMGEGDLNIDNMITAEELTEYVPPKVSSYISSNLPAYTQTPQSYDGITGEFRIK